MMKKSLLVASSLMALCFGSALASFAQTAPTITSDGGGATAAIGVSEGTTAVTTVTADDNDGGGQTITFAISGTDAGDFTIDTNTGVLEFSPAPDFEAPTDDNTDNDYEVTVEATDPDGTATQDITVTVANLDEPSTAVGDSATVAEDDPATTIDVRGNDLDPELAVETIASATDPAGGTVAVAVDGLSLSYEPDANFCNDGTPTDDFDYTLTGGSSATVAVTVTCADDDPVAVDDAATVAEDALATAIDVLANDTDVDGGPKTIASATDPAGGTVVVAVDGLSLTYEPDADVCNDGTPTDDFEYTLSPGGDTGAVAVTVTCVDDAPEAVDDTATVTEDDPATTIDVLANDTDIDAGPKTVASATDPAGGAVVVAIDGLSLTYEPDADFCNTVAGTTDDFDYTLSPGGDTGTVSVTVDCAPDAADDAATVDEDSTSNPIDVLANDDLGDATATVTAVSDPANGSAAINGTADGVEYTPDPDFCNSTAGTTDDFTYTVTDGDGDASTATVAVTVDCAPDALDDTATVDEDSVSNPIAVLANDDVGDLPATVTAVSDPASGSAAINGAADGVEYTPDPDYCNTSTATTDDFTYTVTDADGDSSVANVAVTVSCINDQPTFDAVSDPPAILEDAGPQTVAGFASGMSAGPADEQADQTLTFNIINNSAPAKFLSGPAIDATTGDLTYEIKPDRAGTATIQITLSDNCGSAPTPTCGASGVDTSAAQSFTISINDVNDAPTFDHAGNVSQEAGTGEQTFPWATNVSPGPVNESTQTVAFVVTNVGNPALFAAGGSPGVTPSGNLRYTPVDFAVGSSTITVKLTDDGGTANGGVDESPEVTFTLELVLNSQPVADPQSVATDGSNPLTIVLTGSDPDDQLPLSFQILEPVSDPDSGETTSDTGPFHGTLDTFTPPTNGDDVSATVVYTPNGPFITSAAIIGTDSVLLKAADVASGDVVANNPGATLSLESDTTTPAGFAIKGDVTNVTPESIVGGDAFCNSGNYVGNCDPLAVPVFDALPPFLVGSVGTTNVSVPKNQSSSIMPGLYGSITIGKNATLTFGAGKYSVGSIMGANGAVLAFSGPTEVKVAGRVFVDNNSTVGAAGAASEVVFYVAGVDGTGNKPPRAFDVNGNNTFLYANVYAPNGSVFLRNNTQFTGSIIGKHVEVMNNASVALDSAFSEVPDEFAFEVTDQAGLVSETAIVTINDDGFCRDENGNIAAIAAFSGDATTDGASSITITLEGCEANDSSVTYALVSGPSKGSLGASLPSGPVAGPSPYGFDVTYTPTNVGENELDEFVFSISNGISTAQATVTVNDPPCEDLTASPVFGSTDKGNPLTLVLEACDPNDLPVAFTTGAISGCASCAVGAASPLADTRPGFSSATVVLTHTETTPTVATFSYTADNGTTTDDAAATVEVNAINQAPVAVDDSYFNAPFGAVLADNVLANDSDPNGDPLTANLVGPGPLHGTLNLAANGNFVYTHNGTLNFADSFQYTATDNDSVPLTSNVATVSISIGAADTTVNVFKAGLGAAASTVTSSPGGINCGGTCSALFTTTSVIQLQAAAADNFEFDFWSGDADCADGQLQPLGGTVNCTANFKAEAGLTPSSVDVTIDKEGDGDGTVFSGPVGVFCSLGSCLTPSTFTVATFEEEPRVQLTAAPAPDSRFVGFSGDADCADGNLAGMAPTSCVATFELLPVPRTLTIDVLGAGSGDVTVIALGACSSSDGTCEVTVFDGDTVTLSASPDATERGLPGAPVNVFTGWGGDCAGAGSNTTATLVISGNASCTATFTN